MIYELQSMAIVPDKVEQSGSSARDAPVSVKRPLRRKRWPWLLVVLVVAAAGWLGGWNLWAYHHLRAAEEAARNWEFAEALEHYKISLHVWPNSGPIRLQAARSARLGDLYDQAEEQLTACEKGGTTPETAMPKLKRTRTRRGTKKPFLDKMDGS